MADVNLSELQNANRVLLTISLRPIQGDRFQPTGFPSLGAATYQTKEGPKLLVESAQSMANRLEATCWDVALNAPVEALDGISHVTVTRGKDRNNKPKFLTDSMLEAHRLNSPYALGGKLLRFSKFHSQNGQSQTKPCDFADVVKGEERRLDPASCAYSDILKFELGGLEEGPIDRKKLAELLLKYDVGSLVHGVFLAQKDLAGGRLRIARALSAFIEASGAVVAASGGVKNDHVNPSGDTKSGFGNVPFARDEYVADRIDCHFNLDLAQIRGYGLDPKGQRLLILLALYRVRKLLDGDLRLRTACDLEPVDRDNILATRPKTFRVPSFPELEAALKSAIAECKEMMVHTTLTFEDELKKGKESTNGGDTADEDEATEDSSDQ
jgi:CRISPR-associated protein Csb1